ncbi:hypothetical protein JYU34_011400 [Plutella xylostella]|uniref:Uncharacterized protein n=1 Tax=Plutella xylostella TaxID=51655 RepID=A0ABQ7QGX9_PLUXY|nr:hypothetical protein JYU34_011400 [Plutella xylostella]
MKPTTQQSQSIPSQSGGEVQQHLDAHVPHDEVGHEEGDGARRLRQRRDGVDQRVQHAAGRVGAEQPRGPRRRRARRHVQRAQNPERRDVLQVVEMRAPHALHVRVVELDLAFRVYLGVLRVGEHSSRHAVHARQHGHRQQLQRQYGRVHHVRANSRVIEINDNHFVFDLTGRIDNKVWCARGPSRCLNERRGRAVARCYSFVTHLFVMM